MREVRMDGYCPSPMLLRSYLDWISLVRKELLCGMMNTIFWREDSGSSRMGKILSIIAQDLAIHFARLRSKPYDSVNVWLKWTCKASLQACPVKANINISNKHNMIKTSMITIIIKGIEVCANDMISLWPVEIFKEFSVLMKFSFFPWLWVSAVKASE